MYGFGRKLNSIFAEGKLYDDGNVFIFGSSGLSCDVFVSLVDLLSPSEVDVAVKDCGLVAVDDVAVTAAGVTAAGVTAAGVTAAVGFVVAAAATTASPLSFVAG